MDLATVPPEYRCQTRYLDLATVPPERRVDAYRAVLGHLNFLSREPDFLPVHVVPGTFTTLLRINLYHWRWDEALWGALAEEDPYYHVQAVYPKEAQKPRELLLSPWAALGQGKEALAYLVKETQSKAPLVNGQWLLWQTAAVADRKVNYYDFLAGKVGGLKTIRQFEDLVGFDRKLADKFGGPLLGAVSISGVSREPRAIVAFPTVGGAYTFTVDFKQATGIANPLENTTRNIIQQGDAYEGFAHLPNGLWAMALADSQGALQDRAPDFVGGDPEGLAANNDARIHNYISCLRCHGAGGLRAVDEWVRNQTSFPFSANVFVKDKDLRNVRDFQRAYNRRLDTYLDRHKASYEAAVKAVTGWDGKTYAMKLAEVYGRLEYARVDLAWAARDMQVESARLRAALQKAAELGVGDPSLADFLQPPGRAKGLKVRSWWEKAPHAWETVLKYAPR